MKLTHPLVVLDLEATGADAQRDRIVEIALIKVHPDGRREEFIHRVNPGIRIPSEVIAIHGITNDDIAKAPSFKDLAIPALDFLEGCDLAGFGISRFDVPLLIEEFKRCGFPFPKGDPAIIDALTIFHKKEPRDLTAAYQFFCGKALEGAHGARADALASWDVLKAQLIRYPDLPQDVASLHAFLHKPNDRNVDPRGKFIWRDGEAVFNFGKHKGESLKTLARDQKDYLEWVIHKGDFPQDVVDICWKALHGEFPRKEPAASAPASSEL